VIRLRATRLLVAGAIVLPASGALAPPLAPARAGGRPAPGVDRPVTDARIAESSGLAVSPAHPGMLWTHDDSGNPPLLFALTRTGRVGAAVRVTGVPDVEWEALAAFRDANGRPMLAVGDIGDNLGGRPSVEIDVVAEPAQLRDAPVAPSLRLRLRYPDGPRDAETLLVDSVRGRMFLVSKGLLSSGVYAVPAGAWDGRVPVRPQVRSAELVRVGTVPLVLVTDGAVAPSGTVLLRTYGELAVLDPLPLDGGTRVLSPRATAVLPSQPQGEGLALAPDGRSALLSSEGAGEPVLRFPLPPDVAAALSAPSASASSASASSDLASAGGRADPSSQPASARSSPISRLGLVAGLAAIGLAVILGSLRRIGGPRGRRRG
jgi:hypothetical protein